MNNARKKDASIELLRIIAAFLVVGQHVKLDVFCKILTFYTCSFIMEAINATLTRP